MPDEGMIKSIDLFHWSKDHPGSIAKDIKLMIKDCKNWCPFTHNKSHKTDFGCFLSNPLVKHIVEFAETYEFLFSFLEIGSEEKEVLRQIIFNIKNHSFNSYLSDYILHLKAFLDFIESFQDDFYSEAIKFTCIESVRLGEAINCFKVEAYFASTILAVSAVESRIHSLLKIKNKALYKKEFEMKPLGGILKLLDVNEYKDAKYNKFKRIIPKKHLPLINLLNEYRIFSAHPKEEKIGFNLANSILSLSFAFLLDENLQLPRRYLKKHGGNNSKNISQ